MPAELPLRRVDELSPRCVDRRVLEHDRDVDDDLLCSRDLKRGRREFKGEIAPCIGKVVRHGSAGTLPVGNMAHIGEIDPRGVEIVPDGDAVQGVG